MRGDYDAVIAGGGPAGLAAAIALGESGCQVLVCDQRSLPADKACGEGIMPTGVRELRRLGIVEALPSEAFRTFSGVRYIAPSGREASARFAEGPGLAVRRTALSGALLGRARRTRGVDVLAPARVGSIERTKGLVRVAVDRHTIEASLLIGADGLHSKVRRWAGLSRKTFGARRWGARQHFSLAPWTDAVEVHFSRGVEAYVTPVGPEQVGVALLWDRDRLGVVSGGALIPELLAHFPALAARLHGAESTSVVRAAGPFLQAVRRPVGARVLLIGDAAGYVDALTGEGISLALAQARILAETVAPTLRRSSTDRDRRSGLEAYARGVREITRPHRRLTRLLLWVARYPDLVERLVGAMAADPLVLQQVLSANMGLGSLALPLPRAVRFLSEVVLGAPLPT